MDSGAGRGLDRISSLHDSILCHIPSFLPTKYTVGTNILLPRWRYLWAHSPTPIFDDHDLFQDWDEVTEDRQEQLHVTFADFVNRILHFRKLQPLKSSVSRVQVATVFMFVAIFSIPGLMLRLVAIVRIMNICFCLGDPVDFPLSVYTSETLVDLTLEGGFLPPPPPASVSLPSLKVLNLLQVLHKNDETSQELYSGCPALEELCIIRNYWRGYRPSLNVMAPSLKMLHLVNYMDESEDFLNAEEPNHLTVYAPNMTYFCLDAMFRTTLHY